MKKIYCILMMVSAFHFPGSLTGQTSDVKPRLLIRCDDLGMCHAVNMAAQQLIDAGIPFSGSVMFVCPWYQEIVDILKANPQISAGIHLTLNAEWKNYRWGPVLGAEAVPSLVDSCGHFFPSRALFFAHQPKMEEVEKELRAQIARAMASGLKIDYLDYHMSTVVSTPELRSLVEKLADEYGLGISRYFGEVDVNGIYSVHYDHKRDSLLSAIRGLESDRIHLMVFHIGTDHPEMRAMKDLNPFGLVQMSRHREAELRALCSGKFKKVLKEKNVKLLTYRELIAEMGLQKRMYHIDSL